MRRTLCATITTAVMALVLSASAVGVNPRPLKVDHGGSAVTLQVGPGLQRATFYGTNICLHEAERVRITGVALAGLAGDAYVSDYRVVRGWNGMPGARAQAPKDLRQIPTGSRQVTNRCGPDLGYWVLYVEISMPAGTPATGGTGLHIRYRDETGAKRVATSVHGLYVCNKLSSRNCDALSA